MVLKKMKFIEQSRLFKCGEEDFSNLILPISNVDFGNVVVQITESNLGNIYPVGANVVVKEVVVSCDLLRCRHYIIVLKAGLVILREFLRTEGSKISFKENDGCNETSISISAIAALYEINAIYYQSDM